MGITKDRHGASMPFFSPEREYTAGTYFIQFAVISPVEDGTITYNGVDTLQVFTGEVIAVPMNILSFECSVDFRASGKFSDTPFSLPKIKKEPVSSITAAGDNVELSVSVDANATSLQWFKDGAWVDGETSAILSITSVSASDEGVYFCRVENNLGHIDSTAVRVGIATHAFDVTFETKDFSSNQGGVIRTGYLDAAHQGAAGDCVPPTFDYDSETHQIWEISAAEGDFIRFTVRDIALLTPTQLRLFTPNAGLMATLTRNTGESGYVGVNADMANYFRQHNGDTQSMPIAFVV